MFVVHGAAHRAATKKLGSAHAVSAKAVSLFFFLSLIAGTFASCHSPYGYFPDAEERFTADGAIGAGASGAGGVLIVEEPFWYTRRLGSNDEWRVINGSTAQFSEGQEIIARSATEGASILYEIGRSDAPTNNPLYPTTNSSTLNENEALILVGSLARETYTAIALFSGYYPSIYKTVEISLNSVHVASPLFNIPSSLTYTSPQVLEISTQTFIPPENTLQVPLYYTFTSDGSEPPDPDSESTVYTGPISILPNANEQYRIKVVAIHDNFEDSVIVDASFGRFSDFDNDAVFDMHDVDDDNDGLIEIFNLDMFNAINADLKGQSLSGNKNGAPRSATANCPADSNADGTFLCGYELMANLNFSEASSYAGNSINDVWCPNELNNCGGNELQAGFPGIATSLGNFTGIFEGNGFVIANFYSRKAGISGLFSYITGAAIRNLGLLNPQVFGDSTGGDQVGSLVGKAVSSTIFATFADGGSVSAVSDDDPGPVLVDVAGGLVGSIERSSISYSYARTLVNGGNGGNSKVGGLVGKVTNGGEIIGSFATGNVIAGSGEYHHAGGLVGIINDSSAPFEPTLILAGFSSASVVSNQNSNNGSRMGGLVGVIRTGGAVNITASYSHSSIRAGSNSNDDIGGGLIGKITNGFVTVTASYSTSNVDLRDGGSDKGGQLVGDADVLPTINNSYGFGMVEGLEAPGIDGSLYPTEVFTAQELTAFNTGVPWNSVSNMTNAVWNAGNSSQLPVLVYADYDAEGSTYSCTDLPATIPGTDTPIDCGTTLIGGSANQLR